MAKKNVASLRNCVNACATGDLVCVTACEDAFLLGDGNAVVLVSGGKVFRDSVGGKVFINDGGQIGPLPPGL